MNKEDTQLRIRLNQLEEGIGKVEDQLLNMQIKVSRLEDYSDKMVEAVAQTAELIQGLSDKLLDEDLKDQLEQAHKILGKSIKVNDQTTSRIT